MLAEIVISVVVNGRPVQGSRPAFLRGGVVVAPLDPYVRRIADGIMTAGPDGRITISHGASTVVETLGSLRARSGSIDQTLPIAPFVRGGEANIPLAATARALGATVVYDPAMHAISIHFSRPPLATMTPFAGYTQPTSPVTFTPTSSPTPRVVVTGIPRPRRTPITIESSP